jgi:hypothetical protein
MLLNEDMKKIIAKETFSIQNEFVVRFDDLKSKIFSEITCAKKIAGVEVLK